MEKLRCQRIGCDATFTQEDNPNDSCTFHDSAWASFHFTGCVYLCHQGPILHDGMKEWSCCKKKSHDFSLFLEIPGCKIGKHTTENPVVTRPAATPKESTPVLVPATKASSKEACLRCHQGFFCSDHGSAEMTPKLPNGQAVTLTGWNTELQGGLPAPAKKTVNINEPQTCKNNGCDQTFKDKDNHDTACNYHPGPDIS